MSISAGGAFFALQYTLGENSTRLEELYSLSSRRRRSYSQEDQVHSASSQEGEQTGDFIL
jgi:hypothetical protein